MNADKIKGSLASIFIADSLAMPAHWYYNINDIKKDFGWIKNFVNCPAKHPSSIMAVSNTGGHGRGSQTGNIIGGVILHDKKQYWGKSSIHYHHGMKSGDNTLNALVTRVLVRSINNHQEYSTALFLQDYIKFMTTPGSHNDTYAESYHRDFFANYAQKVAPEKCAGKEDHNTASIGGVVMLPVILLYGHYKLQLKESELIQLALSHLKCTHLSESLNEYATVYCRLFIKVLNHPVHPMPHQDFLQKIQDAAKELPRPFDLKVLMNQFSKLNDPLVDAQVVGNTFSSACYINSSMPSLLFLAGKYAQSGIIPALIANTNVGGDNVHRGSCLGALMGAAFGFEAQNLKSWMSQLTEANGLSTEFETFEKLILKQ